MLVLLCLASTAKADWDKAWQRFEIQAHLENAGRVEVSQRMTARLVGDMTTLECPFSTAPDQKIALRRLVREHEGGETELIKGDERERDRYDWRENVLTWGIKAPGDQWQGETIVFRVEYELRNALAPAWDIPISSERFGSWGEFWHFPVRIRDAFSAWRDAGSGISRRYRYEHEVLFPRFPATGPSETNYTLKYDDAWRQVHPDTDLGRGFPECYRVSQLMEFLPPGRPTAIDWWKPVVRAGSIGLVAFAALVLSLVYLVGEIRKRGLSTPRIDHMWFGENIARQPPEILAWVSDGPVRSCFPDFLARLRNSGVIVVQNEPATEPDADPKVSMRLLIDPSALAPYEREVIADLFPDGPESGTEILAKRYADSGFDPGETLAVAVAKQFGETNPPQPLLWHALTLISPLLFIGGIGLVMFHVFQGNHDWHLCMNALIFAIAFAVIPAVLRAVSPTFRVNRFAPLVPLAYSGIAVIVLVVLQFGTNIPLGVTASAGFALMFTCFIIAIFVSLRTAERPELARRKRDAALATNYAKRELRRATPALSNAWIPQLLALGLGEAIQRWRERPREGWTAPETHPTGLSPFTGSMQPQPEADWADALYILSEEDARELAEDEDEEKADNG